MPTREQVLDMLSNCTDPEIPGVNIVDLGLIYDVAIAGDRVDVTMTLTARGCPMSQQMSQDAKMQVERLRDVSEAHITIVWDPPWNPGMMTESGRRKLGFE